MAGKPRILILSSEYKPIRGGIGTYAHELSIAAGNLGAEVVLFAPDYNGRVQLEDSNDRIRVQRYRGGVHHSAEIPNKFYLAQKAALRQAFDIVHAVDWPFYLPVAALSRGKAPTRLATLHGTEINLMAHPKRKLVLKTFGVMSRFDSLLCNSQFTRTLYRRHFENDLDHSRVTLLGVSNFWHEEPIKPALARTQMSFEPNDLVVLTVGRLTRRKGHLATLQALSNLNEDLRKRLVWVIVGPDGESSYVSELNLKLQNAPFRVRTLTSLSDTDLRKLYKCADLFCLTGTPDKEKVEGFGLVFLEAGAAGVPAIATRTGGVEDAIIHGKTGIIVDVDAPGELTSAIERVLLNQELRGCLSVAAREHARKLSWERCAAETYGL